MSYLRRICKNEDGTIHEITEYDENNNPVYRSIQGINEWYFYKGTEGITKMDNGYIYKYINMPDCIIEKDNYGNYFERKFDKNNRLTYSNTNGIITKYKYDEYGRQISPYNSDAAINICDRMVDNNRVVQTTYADDTTTYDEFDECNRYIKHKINGKVCFEECYENNRLIKSYHFGDTYYYEYEDIDELTPYKVNLLKVLTNTKFITSRISNIYYRICIRLFIKRGDENV